MCSPAAFWVTINRALLFLRLLLLQHELGGETTLASLPPPPSPSLSLQVICHWNLSLKNLETLPGPMKFGGRLRFPFPPPPPDEVLPKFRQRFGTPQLEVKGWVSSSWDGMKWGWKGGLKERNNAETYICIRVRLHHSHHTLVIFCLCVVSYAPSSVSGDSDARQCIRFSQKQSGCPFRARHTNARSGCSERRNLVFGTKIRDFLSLALSHFSPRFGRSMAKDSLWRKWTALSG